MKAASQPAETVAQKQNRTATVPQDFQMNILDGLDACVYISDMETNELLFVNRRTKDTFGLNDSVVGQPCCQVFGDGANTTCGFCPVEQLAQQPATPVVWEQKSTIDGKTYRNVDSVITWVNGKQAHMRQATDITGMMQAQQEAHEARDRLEIALMASHAGVWDLDLQAGTFTYDKWCGKLLGLRPVSGTISAQKLASHFDKIMQSDGGAEVKQALRTQDQNAEWPVRDSKLVFPDGQVRYIRSYGTTERDNAGQTVRVIGMNMDITQSVTLENELKAAKTAAVKQGHADADERTQVMLDATPLAASFWDEEGNMLDCNMEAVRLFGLSGKAEYIEHFYDLNPEYQPDGMSTAEKASAEIAAAFKTGYRRFEWMYLTVDGQPLPVETILVRVPWRGEYRLAAYSRDLREIKAIEQDRLKAIQHSVDMEMQAQYALAASEAKSQFLSNMSHEIRTPMNAIVGMADLLVIEDLNDRQRSYVSDIQTSATSLLGIINDILDFSKIEAGKLQLAPVDYDITQLLHNIESMFMFTAQKKGIFFEMNLRQELPACLLGDDIRLRQALVNILGNAVKFTREGGVRLTVEMAADWLYFEISDTGIGMREEDIPRIFNEFDQLDIRNNRAITGTGLGLAITQNLISMMGGTIRVESEYGKGTTFFVGIPMILGHAENLPTPEKAWKPVYAPQAEILVVDDNEVNLNVVAGLLQLSGIACDTVLSGQAAIDKVKAKQYDLVFMDHMMPEMDGIEATRILRQSHSKEELPIVALTANAIEGVRETLLDAQMNDYLSKPLDKTRLNEVLQKWLPAEKIGEAPQRADAPAEAALSPLLEKVNEIAAVDVPLGLSRIGGLQEAYEKSLRILARRLPESRERLEAFLQAEDLKGFGIEVHGLKGSLNNIGAGALAAEAEELELCAQKQDMEFCRENFPTLAAGITLLQRQLAAAVQQCTRAQAHPKGKGERKALQQQLPMVRDMLDAFEADEAFEMLQELALFDFESDINEQLADIMRLVEEFEYGQAMEDIETLLRT